MTSFPIPKMLSLLIYRPVDVHSKSALALVEVEWEHRDRLSRQNDTRPNPTYFSATCAQLALLSRDIREQRTQDEEYLEKLFRGEYTNPPFAPPEAFDGLDDFGLFPRAQSLKAERNHDKANNESFWHLTVDLSDEHDPEDIRTWHAAEFVLLEPAEAIVEWLLKMKHKNRAL